MPPTVILEGPEAEAIAKQLLPTEMHALMTPIRLCLSLHGDPTFVGPLPGLEDDDIGFYEVWVAKQSAVEICRSLYEKHAPTKEQELRRRLEERQGLPQLPAGVSLWRPMVWMRIGDGPDIDEKLRGKWGLYIQAWPRAGQWGLSMTADAPHQVRDKHNFARMPDVQMEP